MIGLLAFGITIACISPFPDGAQAPRWALLSVAVPLICWKQAVVPGAMSTVALALAGATLLWSPAPWAGFELWWHLTLLVAVAAIAPSDMRPVYLGIGAGLAINAIIVALQVAGFEPVAHNVEYPASGLFFNKNQQALYISLAIIGILGKFAGNSPKFAAASFVAIPLFVPPISRAAWLAVAVVAVVAAARRWPRVMIWIGPAALTALLLAFIGMPRAAANGMRIETWVDMARHLTIFGHGLGATWWWHPEMEFAHNDALQIAFDLGLVGLTAIIAITVYVVHSGPCVERLVLLAFMIEGLFDFPLYQPATGFLAALCAGHILRARARHGGIEPRGEPAGRDWAGTSRSA